MPMHGVADSLNVSVSAAVLLYEARRQRDRHDGRRRLSAMDTFDFVIIGAGPAGEAAAYKARELGRDGRRRRSRAGSAASCPHIGCVPSKALLHSAARHAANPRRVRLAASLGAPRLHGQPGGRRRRARRHGPRRRARGGRRASRTAARAGSRAAAGWRSRHDGVTPRARRRRTSSSPSGSTSKVPPLEGIETIPLLDEPRGDAGPRAAGEPARPRRRSDRLRARPGLRPVRRARRRSSSPGRGSRRPIIRATPRPSGTTLENDGVTVRIGVRALRAQAGAGDGRGARHRPRRRHERAEGHAILLAVGRSFPIDDLGLEHYGIDTSGRTPFPRDGRLRIADGLWIVGDPAGPGAAHPPGPLPGRAGGPDGARRDDHARLPGPAAGDLHRPEAAFGRA